MQRAFDLARKGTGRVSPNPMVGAVLVSRGRILAEGFHARFGGPHAEAVLLRHLATSGLRVPADAILYLTLEPCAHRGKTAPCAEALCESPIRRFVVATMDPYPRVRGRGIRALRRAGRSVRVGLLSDEARALNPAFFLAHREGRARVTLKLASTLDGMLADAGGRSRWITGPLARREVGRLRMEADAVVVGRGTVEADDPRIRAPRGRTDRAPSRLVVDGRLAINPSCRLARLWRESVADLLRLPGVLEGNWVLSESVPGAPRWARRPRLIVATSNPSEGRISAFRQRGWEVWELPAKRPGRVDLVALARRAAREGLHDLLVEPGPGLSAAFLSGGPVDRILLFLAPRVLGGDRGWSRLLPPLALTRALRPCLAAPPRIIGGDLLLELSGRRGRPIVPARRAAGDAVKSS